MDNNMRYFAQQHKQQKQQHYPYPTNRATGATAVIPTSHHHQYHRYDVAPTTAMQQQLPSTAVAATAPATAIISAAPSMPDLDDLTGDGAPVEHDSGIDLSTTIAIANSSNNHDELMSLSSAQQYDRAQELLKSLYQPPPPPPSSSSVPEEQRRQEVAPKRKSTSKRKKDRQQQQLGVNNSSDNDDGGNGGGGRKRKRRTSATATMTTPPPPHTTITAMDVATNTEEEMFVDPSVDTTGGCNENERSFHEFVEMLNRHNLLPQSAQVQHAETIRSSMTSAEVALCRGSGELARRNHTDQFQLLCQGTNVNPECAKRRVVRTIGSFLLLDNDSVDDKTAIRYVYLWYEYAPREECSLESLSVSSLLELFSSSTDSNVVAATGDKRRRLVDERLGRMCQSCVEHFLRFNNMGKLCPKLFQRSTAAVTTSSTTTRSAVGAPTRSTAITATNDGGSNPKKQSSMRRQPKSSTAAVVDAATTGVGRHGQITRKVGLGAARKKLSVTGRTNNNSDRRDDDDDDGRVAYMSRSDDDGSDTYSEYDDDDYNDNEAMPKN